MQKRFEPRAATASVRFAFLGNCFAPKCKPTDPMKEEKQHYKCERAKARKKENSTTYGRRPSSDVDDDTMTISMTITIQ